MAALLLLLPLAGLLHAIRLDAPFYLNSSPLGISARLYGWAEYAHQLPQGVVAPRQRHSLSAIMKPHTAPC